MRRWWHRYWWIFAVLGVAAWAGSPDGYCWMHRLPCRTVFQAGLPFAPPPPAAPAWTATHVVGPGRQHETIQTVPWEDLKPGDVVEIHWRDEPYRDKWYIPASGAEGAPIVVRGVRANGKRPVFDAANAKTRPHRGGEWNNEDRGLIKIGDLAPEGAALWIVVEGLELRGAKVRVPYIGSAGRPWTYQYNAAGLYVEHGRNVVLRDNDIHDNGDGIFVGSPVRGGPENWSHSANVLIEYNYIHDNSYEGDGDQYHNLYLEALDVLVQWNRLVLNNRPNANNLKDRSSSAVVRHNWIEGGNRQVDLVETVHPHLSGRGGSATVEGNVLIDHRDWGNSQIVNFGRDRTDKAGAPRSFLRMRDNVLMSPRPDAVGLRVSDAAELDVTGNVLYADLQPNAGRWFWLPASMPDPVGNTIRTVADFAAVRTALVLPVRGDSAIERVTLEWPPHGSHLIPAEETYMVYSVPGAIPVPLRPGKGILPVAEVLKLKDLR